MSASKKQAACRFFLRGDCKNGSKCRFGHGNPSSSSSGESVQRRAAAAPVAMLGYLYVDAEQLRALESELLQKSDSTTGYCADLRDEESDADGNAGAVARAEDVAQKKVAKIREQLWVVHKQIKINDADLHLDEGLVTERSSLNHGMSVSGFYSRLADCNAACRAAFYDYMKNKFNWGEQEVMANLNKFVNEPPIRSRDGTELYYWEGKVVWKHWVRDDSEYREERERKTEAYGVVSFSPYMVEIN